MSIDFFYLSDKNNVVFELDENEFSIFENEFSIFQQKTAINIDQYGTTKLSTNHIKLLIGLVENKKVDQESGCEYEALNKLKDFLTNAYKKNTTLILEGD